MIYGDIRRDYWEKKWTVQQVTGTALESRNFTNIAR